MGSRLLSLHQLLVTLPKNMDLQEAMKSRRVSQFCSQEVNKSELFDHSSVQRKSTCTLSMFVTYVMPTLKSDTCPKARRKRLYACLPVAVREQEQEHGEDVVHRHLHKVALARSRQQPYESAAKGGMHACVPSRMGVCSRGCVRVSARLACGRAGDARVRARVCSSRQTCAESAGVYVPAHGRECVLREGR